MVKMHVVILNWNGAEDTIECLDSLLVQSNVSLECIVVDNCSSDDSVRRIRERFPLVHMIENKENLGFPAGMNVGIRFALSHGAKYVLLLNNDTIAMPGMLLNLLSSVSHGVGFVAPAIFYAQQPSEIWSVGGKIHPIFLEMAATTRSTPVLPSRPVERDFVAGCAMLVQAEIFQEVGLLDERFFPGYYEDLDFCLRIRRRGYRIQIIPQAHLLHKVSRASGGQYSSRVYFLMARNSAYYFRKHMRLWQSPFIIFYRLLSALKTSVRLIWKHDFQSLSAYWIGFVNGWTNLLAKRSEKFIAYYKKG